MKNSVGYFQSAHGLSQVVNGQGTGIGDAKKGRRGRIRPPEGDQKQAVVIPSASDR